MEHQEEEIVHDGKIHEAFRALGAYLKQQSANTSLQDGIGSGLDLVGTIRRENSHGLQDGYIALHYSSERHESVRNAEKNGTLANLEGISRTPIEKACFALGMVGGTALNISAFFLPQLTIMADNYNLARGASDGIYGNMMEK